MKEQLAGLPCNVEALNCSSEEEEEKRKENVRIRRREDKREGKEGREERTKYLSLSQFGRTREPVGRHERIKVMFSCKRIKVLSSVIFVLPISICN